MTIELDSCLIIEIVLFLGVNLRYIFYNHGQTCLACRAQRGPRCKHFDGRCASRISSPEMREHLARGPVGYQPTTGIERFYEGKTRPT